MKSTTIINLSAVAMLLAVIGLMVLSSCRDSNTRTNSQRIEKLESDQLELKHNQLYIDEVIRTRRVSPEHCEWLSGGGKTCSLRGEPLNCVCDYKPDDWDKASFAFQVNAKAKELVAAQEAAKLAAEEEQAPEKLASEEADAEGEGDDDDG